MEETLLDDDANTDLSQGSSPFTGSYRPLEPLSAFHGETANGDWLLQITDDRLEILGGYITSLWNLLLNKIIFCLSRSSFALIEK